MADKYPIFPKIQFPLWLKLGVIIVLVIGLGLIASCHRYPNARNREEIWDWRETETSISFGTYTEAFGEEVLLKDYFEIIDSLIAAYDSLTPYELDEHLLVNANAWLIDSLAATDYYVQAQRGSFVYDQKAMAIIPASTKLLIPDSLLAAILLEQRAQTLIDLNVPEFRLRILQGEKELERFPVRIGQNKVGLIPILDRAVDWRTQLGEGHIVGHNRNPLYHNFKTGKAYEFTRRDDGKTTLMPQIPSIEPEINGVCSGQLIHATTNPRSLGKAYSHGCVGVREGDAWRIYYHAPLGTQVRFRYELLIITSEGDSLFLEDVYGLFQEDETQYSSPINLP